MLNGTNRPSSRQSPLDAQHGRGDSSRVKMPMPSPTTTRTGRHERPIERFCSEQQRHEKIALMMSGGRDEAHTLRHVYGPDSRAPDHYYCTQDAHVLSPVVGFAGGPIPHKRTPSPAFQPYLEVDGDDDVDGEGECGEGGSNWQAIRMAARIK